MRGCKPTYASVEVHHTLEITKTVIRVCIHNLRRPTSNAREDGRQTGTWDNVAHNAFLRVCFAEKNACQTPFLRCGCRAGHVHSNLCPRRQRARCHKTLSQQPLQPHYSPVIWQLRVWQRRLDQIFGVIELCCLEDHTEATILELTCCTHARPMCCREQKAD